MRPWLEFPPAEWIHWNLRVKSKAQAIAIVQKRYSKRKAWGEELDWSRASEIDKYKRSQLQNRTEAALKVGFPGLMALKIVRDNVPIYGWGG